MTGLPFEQWERDPEFQSLPVEQKAKAYSNFFDRNMADDEFRALPTERQQGIKDNFLSQNIKPVTNPAPMRGPMPLGQQKIGALETAASAGTGIIGSLLGGLTYLSNLASGNEKAQQQMRNVQESFTYQPRTEAG